MMFKRLLEASLWNSNFNLSKILFLLIKIAKNKTVLQKRFLKNIDMIAYYNVMSSKGIKNYEDLLACNKTKFNDLKISQADTKILWASIQTAKLQQPEVSVTGKIRKEPIVKKQKIESLKNNEHALPRPPEFIKDSFFTESFFEISKYQIKFNDCELKSFIK